MIREITEIMIRRITIVALGQELCHEPCYKSAFHNLPNTIFMYSYTLPCFCLLSVVLPCTCMHISKTLILDVYVLPTIL